MLKIKDLSKKYDQQIILDNINIEFKEKGFYVLLGESGAGKSTLLKMISLFEEPTHGEIIYQGKNILENKSNVIGEKRNTMFSYIFQEFNLIEYLTVKENLMLVEHRDVNQIKEVLEKFGLGAYLEQEVSKLSGGERQRVTIARAILRDTPILIADEPTGNLDQKNSEEVIKILEEVSKTKLVIMVTHNESLLDQHVDYIYRIDNHKLILEQDQHKIYKQEVDVKQHMDIKDKLDKNTLVKTIVHNYANTRLKYLISILIISIFMMVTILSFGILLSDNNKMYYEYIVKNEEKYILVDEDRRYVSPESILQLESDELRTYIESSIDVDINIQNYLLIHIEKLSLDNSLTLNGNEISISEKIANEFLIYYSEQFKDIDELIGQSINIENHNYLIKTIVSGDSSMLILTREGIVQLMDETISVRLSNDSSYLGSFSILLDDELTMNEVALNSRYMQELSSSTLKTVNIYPYADLEIQVTFIEDATLDIQTLKVSKDIFDTLMINQMGFQISINQEGFTEKNMTILTNSGQFVDSSFLTNFVLVHTIKDNYTPLIVMLGLLIAFMFKMLLDIYLNHLFISNSREYYILKSIGKEKYIFIIQFINQILLLIPTLLISFLVAFILKNKINNITEKYIYPGFNISLFDGIIIIVFILVVTILINYVYEFKKIKTYKITGLFNG